MKKDNTRKQITSPERPAPRTMTEQQLSAVLIRSGVPASRADLFSPHLLSAFKRYGITTPLRIGHFLGQVLHESVLLRYQYEIWGPTNAQRRYEGRADLGNTQPGDGFRFRGRGIIQLTGRANYEEYSRYRQTVFGENVDFTRTPNTVAELPAAADVAGWFWTVKKRLNRIADRGDDVDEVREITRAINGGYNGLDDRINLFRKVMREIRDLDVYQNDTSPII